MHFERKLMLVISFRSSKWKALPVMLDRISNEFSKWYLWYLISFRNALPYHYRLMLLAWCLTLHEWRISLEMTYLCLLLFYRNGRPSPAAYEFRQLPFFGFRLLDIGPISIFVIHACRRKLRWRDASSSTTPYILFRHLYIYAKFLDDDAF